MNWALIIAVFIAGCGVSFQAGINGALGRKIGSIEAAFTSFAIGTLILSVILLFYRKGNILGVFEVPKWQLLGGALGAFYVFIMVLAVPRFGIAASLTTLIVGQLLCSIFIDHYGLIHGNAIPVSLNRVLAIMIMTFALYLFFRK